MRQTFVHSIQAVFSGGPAAGVQIAITNSRFYCFHYAPEVPPEARFGTADTLQVQTAVYEQTDRLQDGMRIYEFKGIRKSFLDA